MKKLIKVISVAGVILISPIKSFAENGYVVLKGGLFAPSAGNEDVRDATERFNLNPDAFVTKDGFDISGNVEISGSAGVNMLGISSNNNFYDDHYLSSTASLVSILVQYGKFGRLLYITSGMTLFRLV